MAAPVHRPAPGWDCHVHVFDGRPVAGHYQPVRRWLPDIEALAQAQGCGHLVLVQPSVYGSDNGLLLHTLRTAAGRHCGIVVLDGRESAQQLDAMDDDGVRGVRFNLVSPVGSARAQVPALLRQLAPAIRERGWHVQWYAAPGDLAQLVQLQQECGLPFVLDHLAGMTPAHADDQAAWAALQALAQAGSWIKLSGWYRLQSGPPYDDLVPLVQRVGTMFAGHMVWASDWPHTSFEPDALPAYESLWSPVVAALGSAAAQSVRLAGAQLYA
jgi:predicted TIM-barrel fold metal-dependent hydrolase